MRKRFKVRSSLLTILGALAFIATQTSGALAQCAMCKASVQASTTTSQATDVFNLAVLVLLLPPVLIFCAFMVVLWRYRKSLDEGTVESLDNAQGL